MSTLKPEQGTLRIIFLYVGQGDATLLIIPDGDSHQYVLVDSNTAEEGEDIAQLLEEEGIPKDSLIFINTHPHKDHLQGIKEIYEKVGIAEIWHSGHTPHKDNKDAYNMMSEVLKKIGKDNEFFLRGSNEINVIHTDKDDTSKINKQLGDIDYQVLSPAEYVCDKIDDEAPEVRRKRIHEQCGVIKFTYQDVSLIITGDSDKEAWKEHITAYHKDNLKADILSASHHGSRTFFKENEEDKEPFTEHLETINPDYLIISAPPKGKDSQFDHPHDDAMEIYEEHIAAEGINNLGDNKESLIIDIDQNGKLSTGGAGAINKQSKEDLSHWQKPKWKSAVQRKIRVNGYIASQKNEKTTNGINSNGRKVAKNLWVKFIANDSPLDADIYWQVVNTGKQARDNDGLRGDIIKGRQIKWEETQYTGQHWVQCFAVQNNTCVAQSDRFFVNIV